MYGKKIHGVALCVRDIHVSFLLIKRKEKKSDDLCFFMAVPMPMVPLVYQCFSCYVDKEGFVPYKNTFSLGLLLVSILHDSRHHHQLTFQRLISLQPTSSLNHARLFYWPEIMNKEPIETKHQMTWSCTCLGRFWDHKHVVGPGLPCQSHAKGRTSQVLQSKRSAVCKLIAYVFRCCWNDGT